MLRYVSLYACQCVNIMVFISITGNKYTEKFDFSFKKISTHTNTVFDDSVMVF